MKHIKNIITLAAIFLLILQSNAQQLPGTWPELDKPPPYDQKFNGLVDFTKVPSAPVKNSADDCAQANNYCDWSCTGCTRDSDIVECPNKGDWGLSFDDGPSEYTDSVLDYLASQNIRVTFFVVGSRVYENPGILLKAVQAGHQIGVHTWSHTPLTTQSNEAIVAEMQWTAEAIKAAVGVTPTYMRPPYGDFDDRVRQIVIQLGYKPTIWDRDTNDWLSDQNPSFDLDWVEGNFSQWVKEPSTTGHISLEHDLYKQTAAQAPKVVPIVKAAGYNIQQIAVCRGDDQPYLEDVKLNSTIGDNSTSFTGLSTSQTATDGGSLETGINSAGDVPTFTNTRVASTSIPHVSNAKTNLPFSLLIIILINSYVISCTVYMH
ncbi:15478_t:CDS:2 [Acaulospora morrowiae]|uniref:15478_t:CDS:1 n=1 Tax=Acaulospora morrowiae TaxID=94023 RepID=A0A9N8VY51_9GLOM|nr:15478_t:CDS:2 [Acaulospora morrowiae]